MIPAEQTRIIVQHELEGALSWAERHGVRIDWLPNDLGLHATLLQPATNATFFLRGMFQDYRALPPEWTFTNERWETSGQAMDFPEGAQSSFGSPMFIMHNQKAVICAPFNRLAYSDLAGPHRDWGGPANWLNAGASQIHADTIGDMLQAIHRDFSFTRSRLAKP